MYLILSDVFILDNADMHFVRSSDGLTGRNLTKNDLCYLWCGVKANYGIKSGKVCYECKVIRYNNERNRFL